MTDRVDAGKATAYDDRVPDVAEHGLPVGRRQGRTGSVGCRQQGVEDPYVGTAPEELLHHVRADEAGPAGDEHAHAGRLGPPEMFRAPRWFQARHIGKPPGREVAPQEGSHAKGRSAMNHDYASWAGRDLIGSDGSKIGTIDQLYADKDTGEPTFATVNTGMFGSKTNFVPVSGANMTGDDVSVPYDKDLVKSAPNVDPDGEITPEEEQRLYQHYNMSAPGGYNDTTRDYDYDQTTTRTEGYDATSRAGVSDTTDDAMTRSEERLRVGTEQQEVGRARLRKYVTTENVQQTVPVTREEVRIDREPITDANVGDAMSGPDLTEDVHEVTLTEERPVVEKETVPVERVRLGKEQVTENVEVTEQVRKEQIETDGGDVTDRRDDTRTR